MNKKQIAKSLSCIFNKLSFKMTENEISQFERARLADRISKNTNFCLIRPPFKCACITKGEK